MADDEILFDDVYELCEIIGNYFRIKPDAMKEAHSK